MRTSFSKNPLTFEKRIRQNKNTKASIRAQQLWPYLVMLAHNRQTVRYAEVCKFLKYDPNATGHGPLRWPLDHIYQFCRKHGLPDLNDLVVSKAHGKPGYYGLGEEFNPEAIFDYDWWQHPIPSASAFENAWENNKI